MAPSGWGVSLVLSDATASGFGECPRPGSVAPGALSSGCACSAPVTWLRGINSAGVPGRVIEELLNDHYLDQLVNDGTHSNQVPLGFRPLARTLATRLQHLTAGSHRDW